VFSYLGQSFSGGNSVQSADSGFMRFACECDISMTIRATDQLGRNAAASQALSEPAFSPIDLIEVAGSNANPGPRTPDSIRGIERLERLERAALVCERSD
jgi:hypothetical protein